MNIFVSCLVNLFIIASLIYPAHAMDPEAIARSGLSQAQGFAQSEASGAVIPGYSRSDAESKANELERLDDAQMKAKANAIVTKASPKDPAKKLPKDPAEDSPTGTVIKGMNKKLLDGMEEHEAFKKAEKIWIDPAAALERFTAADCKEQANETKNPYTKRVTKEKQYDTELYEKTCEKPANNIVCTKTLSVACEATKECEAGGIELGSIESGVEWKYTYPNMRFGSKEGTWKFSCKKRKGYQHCCEKIVSTAKFKLRDVSEIKAFALRKVAFDDHAMIKINGHIAYNSWGGYQLNITNRHVRKYHSKAGWLSGEYNLFIDAGHGKGAVCFQWLGKNNSRTMNVDLKPYLKEGWNEIEMTLVYAELGQFNIEIEARQQCCTKLTDKWVKRCWEE